MVVEADANEMLLIGLNCIGFGPARTIRHCETTQLKHFVSSFGIDPNTCGIVFNEIQTRDIGQNRIAKPKVPHFLMALYWLKQYPIEHTSSGLFGYHEDTVRKWVWKYCQAIQALKQYKIVWIDHEVQHDDNQPDVVQTAWFLSVDGTHCRVREPRTVPDKDWYSHKHHKPCVAYEIAIDLQQSKIVWISGPHKAGETDLLIFRKPDGLKSKLPEHTIIIGDKGYVGENVVSVNNDFDEQQVKTFKRIARARHEDVNGRIKRFQVLSSRFRHPLPKHKIAFEAVCVIIQYSFENGHPLHLIPVANL